MSYAMLRDALDTGGIWSIARGLARNVETYKAHLAACDQPRRNDLDGATTRIVPICTLNWTNREHWDL